MSATMGGWCQATIYVVDNIYLEFWRGTYGIFLVRNSAQIARSKVHSNFFILKFPKI